MFSSLQRLVKDTKWAEIETQEVSIKEREIERQVCVVCVLCREMERETEGDREAGVCSVCIMQSDGERDRGR